MWGWKLSQMINECLLSEGWARESELAEVIEKASSRCDEAHPGKATEKKIVAINTD